MLKRKVLLAAIKESIKQVKEIYSAKMQTKELKAETRNYLLGLNRAAAIIRDMPAENAVLLKKK